MRFVPRDAERAGLAVVQALNHQLQIGLCVEDGGPVLRVDVVTMEYDRPPFIPGFAGETRVETVARLPWDDPEVILQVQMEGQSWVVRCGKDRRALKQLALVDGAVINPERIGGMTGTMLGMFATGGGKDSDDRAEFDWFEMI